MTVCFWPLAQKITGNVDGGGGTNDLTLDANSGSQPHCGSVLNFHPSQKGEGAWAILGGVPAVSDDQQFQVV